MTAHHEVVIVGSGFAGLGMAIELKRAGIEPVRRPAPDPIEVVA